uniref:NAC domain-containing protein 29 isoform 1 n=1 Tax=Albuca bracteata TaxID=82047 RepID=A0A0A7LUB2_ALBBR|nr:NAC domain-containing protein 29 isoform 1 [Albuca bracteata]
MEKLMRLPPGFRFHPTDEELVVQYLRRKALSWPLPAAIIPEIDLGRFDPWDLPGCHESERYFFNLRDAKYRKGNGSSRATRSGYWKATGKDRIVRGSKHNEIVGMKKVLVFHQGKKPPHGVRTRWIMHEYRLACSETHRNISNDQSSSMVQGKDWVVCRIFKKKRASDTNEEDAPRCCNNHVMFMEMESDNGDREPRSPNSASSCVTELSDDECSNGEEASSKLIALSTP